MNNDKIQEARTHIYNALMSLTTVNENNLNPKMAKYISDVSENLVEAKDALDD